MKDKTLGGKKARSQGARYTAPYGMEQSVGNPGAGVTRRKTASDFIQALGSHNSKTRFGK